MAKIPLAFAVLILCAVSAVPVSAATIRFNPAAVNETLDNNIGDDDLKASADLGRAGALQVNAGDTGRWDYKYKTPYRIVSNDPVDVDVTMSLVPVGPGRKVIDNVIFFLTRENKEIPNTRLTLTDPPAVVLGTVATVTFFGDQELGRLKGTVFDDFHFEFKLTQGVLQWRDTDVSISADDIAAVPLPPSFVALLAPIAVLAGVNVRRRAGRRQEAAS